MSDGGMEKEPAGISEMCVFGFGCAVGCFTVLKDILVWKKKNKKWSGAGERAAGRRHPDAKIILKFYQYMGNEELCGSHSPRTLISNQKVKG